MKISVADLIEEQSVVDGVECLRDANGSCTKHRFPLVEALGNASDSGEEGSNSGVGGAKTMLGRGKGEGGGEMGEDEALKDLRDGAEEGDGAVRSREEGGLTGFRDQDNKGLPPHRGNIRGGNREVKNMS